MERRAGPRGRPPVLIGRLAEIRAPVIACPGDGNLDGTVDDKDLLDWASYAQPWGLSSVYDLNLDGRTDSLDEALAGSTYPDANGSTSGIYAYDTG